MSADYLFGPYFFPATVTGDAYRTILEEFFWPDFCSQLSEDDLGAAWFMHDGVPAHTALESRQLIQRMFCERLVGRYFKIEWHLFMVSWFTGFDPV